MCAAGGQEFAREGLLCLPRPTYGNSRAWTHSFETPSYKVGRMVITSVCDHLRVVHKLLPPVAAHPNFVLCDKMWWFGFMRCFQIDSPDKFYPFRHDYAEILVPAYKKAFAEFTTVQVGTSITIFPVVVLFFPFNVGSTFPRICKQKHVCVARRTLTSWRPSRWSTRGLASRSTPTATTR